MARGAVARPEPKLSPEQMDELLRGHEDLCWHLAQKHGMGLSEADVEDLAAVARLRLVRCAQTFDPSKGFKFTTYAYRLALREVRYAARKIWAAGQTLPTDWRTPVRAVKSIEIPFDDHGDKLEMLLACRDADAPDPGEVWGWVRGHLGEREYGVLVGLFRDGKKLHVVGAELRLSKERVRQIRDGAFEKLRAAGAAEHLGDAA